MLIKCPKHFETKSVEKIEQTHLNVLIFVKNMYLSESVKLTLV